MNIDPQKLRTLVEFASYVGASYGIALYEGLSPNAIKPPVFPAVLAEGITPNDIHDSLVKGATDAVAAITKGLL